MELIVIVNEIYDPLFISSLCSEPGSTCVQVVAIFTVIIICIIKQGNFYRRQATTIIFNRATVVRGVVMLIVQDEVLVRSKEVFVNVRHLVDSALGIVHFARNVSCTDVKACYICRVYEKAKKPLDTTFYLIIRVSNFGDFHRHNQRFIISYMVAGVVDFRLTNVPFQGRVGGNFIVVSISNF